MRPFVTLFLCCLVVGSLAASTLRRTGRDAKDGSGEHLPAELRSTALMDLTEDRSSRQISDINNPLSILLLKIVGNAYATMLLLQSIGGLFKKDNRTSLLRDIPSESHLMEEFSEYLLEFPTDLELGSHLDGIVQEASLAIQDLNAMLDEGAFIAEAKLQGGAQGELSFVQSQHPTDNDATIISGTLLGLKPGLHKLQVTMTGDISNYCVNAGEAYSDESNGIFVVNNEGKAMVLVRATNAPLRGADTILGRSVVITSLADPDTREDCGVIGHPSSY